MLNSDLEALVGVLLKAHSVFAQALSLLLFFPLAFEDCVTASAVIESAIGLLKDCVSRMPPGNCKYQTLFLRVLD